MTFDKTQNKKTGAEGESEAEKYLRGLGYKILKRNYKLFCGEIDILAQEGKTIVIVEVKTVKGSGFGLAQELVRYKKQKKLRLLGRTVEQQYPNCPIRIDVIGVNPDGLEHIKNAVS